MGFYSLAPEAEDDFSRIWLRGIHHFGEVQADQYYYDFITRFEQIAETPKLYPSVNSLRQGYRRTICGVDSIYCRITKSGVEIMRILGQKDISETKGEGGRLTFNTSTKGE